MPFVPLRSAKGPGGSVHEQLLAACWVLRASQVCLGPSSLDPGCGCYSARLRSEGPFAGLGAGEEGSSSGAEPLCGMCQDWHAVGLTLTLP